MNHARLIIRIVVLIPFGLIGLYLCKNGYDYIGSTVSYFTGVALVLWIWWDLGDLKQIYEGDVDAKSE